MVTISLRTIDINLITGKKESGKSFFTKNVIFKFQRIIVWDYNHEHIGDFITTDLKQIVPAFNSGKKHIIYRPMVKTESQLNLFCGEVLKCNNLMCVIEEAPIFFTSWYNRTMPNAKALVDTGRFQGIGLTVTARRILKLAVDIPYNADNIIIFKMERPQDKKYLAEYVGLDKDEFSRRMDNLKEHGFMWYDGSNLYDMEPIRASKGTQNINSSNVNISAKNVSQKDIKVDMNVRSTKTKKS